MRGWRVAAVLDVANNNNNQREFLALDVREKLQRKEPFLPEDGARSIPYIVGWEVVRKVVYLKYSCNKMRKTQNEHLTLFENESITDINYPALFSLFLIHT